MNSDVTFAVVSVQVNTLLLSRNVGYEFVCYKHCLFLMGGSIDWIWSNLPGTEQHSVRTMYSNNWDAYFFFRFSWGYAAIEFTSTWLILIGYLELQDQRIFGEIC